MQIRSRFACLSAAVLATVSSGSLAEARDLIYDPLGTTTATGSDGSGSWDTSTANWVDPTSPGTDTTFSSVNPDSARFGTSNTVTTVAANATPLIVFLTSNVTAQNLTFANAASGVGYNLLDFGDSSQLTLNGNIFKIAGLGSPQIALTNTLLLSAGNHTIAVRDSPGDAAPELVFNSALGGAGAVTIDTSLNYAASGGGAADVQYGTVAFNVDNSYAGGTNITSGRLVANTSGSLGGGAVSISGAGALAFAGAGTTNGDLTLANDFTISRSDYATANTNNRYQDAIVANNDGSVNTITFNGAITVNSTDARITANTNTIVIAKPLVAGATGATSVLDLSGDFAGFITLAADNTAYGNAGGAIQFRNGVEINASSEANLGGATSKLILSGGEIHATGTLGAAGSAFMTNFGTHNLGTTPIATGLDLDAGQVFNVSGISGNSIGTRGAGTINFNAGNVFTGKPFFDAGTVNFNNDITLGGFATRSPTVNVAGGVTITATNTANEAIVIGSNSPDTSSITIASTNALKDAGGLALGDSKGATGTLNNAGTVTVGSEFWVGNNGGTGTFTQTAGTTAVNNWFAVGRDVVNAQGTKGTVVISGGSVTKTGGGNSYVAQGVNGVATMTLSNNASFTAAAGGGEFWVGQDGGNGTLTIQDTASFTVNNWLALGRSNGASVGTLNLNGGTLTKVAGSNGFLAIGSGGTGTLTQTAGVMNISGTRLAENSSGTMNLNGGTSTFTGEFSVGYVAGGVGTLNISGGANVTVPNAVLGVNATVATNGGVINLNGGTLTGASFTAGAAATRLSQFNFNGGTLRPSATNTTNFVGAKVTSAVLGGGAIVDTNGFNANIASTMVHGGTAANDGGLTKLGAGTLTLTGANAYTGTTIVNNAAGTLNVTYAATGTSASSPLLTGPNGADIQNGKVVFNYTGSTTPAATIRSALTTSYGTHFASGQLRSTTNVNTPSRALGYGDDTAASAVTVLETYFGDATLDGIVNVSDLGVLATNYGSSTGVWTQGDFNYDGSVNVSDLGLLATYYGSGSTLAPNLIAAQFKSDLAYVEQQNPVFAAAMGITPSAVPEPASLAAIAVGSIGLFGRRRRRADVAR